MMNKALGFILVLSVAFISVSLLLFLTRSSSQQALSGEAISKNMPKTLSAPVPTSQAQSPSQEQNMPKNQKIIPGTINIKFKENYPVTYENDAARIVQSIKQRLPGLADVNSVKKAFQAYPQGKNYLEKKKFGLDRWVQVTIPVDKDVNDEIKKWKLLPEVETAEPSYIPVPTMTPNDPLFPQQWHHFQSSDKDIDSTDAWNIVTGSPNVIIAIIDTDLDWRHEDLIDNIWQNLGEDADQDGHVLEFINSRWEFDPGDINGADDDGNGYADDFIGWGAFTNDPSPPSDYYESHGTITSGTAAARGNNGKGVSGVCMYCRLMFYYYSSGGGIEYAADNNANIISMSFTSLGYSTISHDVIQYAYSQNVILIAGAGNSNNEIPKYPAAYNEVLAITNSNGNDYMHWSSSRGGWTDIAAPGVDIWTTRNHNSYSPERGTSLSTPVVAGVAGLMKSRYPSLTNEEVYSILQTKVDPTYHTPTSPFYGQGRVNANYAIQYQSFPIALLKKEPALTDLFQDFVTIEGSAKGTNFQRYTLEVGRGNYPTTWTTITTSTTPINNGVLGTINVAQFPERDHYSIRLTTYNTAGTSAIDIIVVSIGGPLAELDLSMDELLSDTQMDVIGSAQAGGFQSYTLQYGVGTNPSTWTTLFTGTTPVIDALLASVDISSFAENTYTLKLTVNTAFGETAADTSTFFVLHGTNVVPLSNWPKTEIFPTTLSYKNIDDEPLPEIIATSSNGGLYAWKADGTLFSSLFSATQNSVFTVAPAIGNIDSERNIEFLIAGFNLVYALNSDGSSITGWPKMYSQPITLFIRNILLNDVDDDYQDEIVIAGDGLPNTPQKVIIEVLEGDGTTIHSWDTGLPEYVNMTDRMALGDLDNDNHADIIIPVLNSIRTWKNDGTPLFFTPMSGLKYSSPATLGDVDGDGALEIIQRFQGVIKAFNNDNTLLFSKTGLATTPAVSEAVLGDIDADGLAEIILSDDNKIYAWNGDGTDVLGWPVTVNLFGLPEKLSRPVLIDLNNDGKSDVLISIRTKNNFIIKTYGGNGVQLPYSHIGRAETIDTAYWFNFFPDMLMTTDANGDGTIELFIGIDDAVYGYSLTGSVYNPSTAEWTQFRRTTKKTGLYQKNCQDTLNEECSLSKPKYCQNGNLLDKCQLCGCLSTTLICNQDGTCSGGGSPIFDKRKAIAIGDNN